MIIEIIPEIIEKLAYSQFGAFMVMTPIGLGLCILFINLTDKFKSNK